MIKSEKYNSSYHYIYNFPYSDTKIKLYTKFKNETVEVMHIFRGGGGDGRCRIHNSFPPVYPLPHH
jgi:hypothetical protein